MSTIVSKLMKGWGTIRYEWFLRLFGTSKYAKIEEKLCEKLGIDIKGVLRDELWCMGLVVERGSDRMGREVRKKIQRELLKMDLKVRKRVVKRKDVIERCREGRVKLAECGRLMGYLKITDEYGLVMFQRDMGFMVITGRGWAYVYKTGHTFSYTDDLIEIGYFRLDGDVELGLRKAMNGEMRYRVQEHAVRRKLFIGRRVQRNARAGIKRKQDS